MDKVVQKKLKDFFTQYKHKTYRKGEILVRADDNPPGIFYLTAGNVRKYAISAKGDELVVNIFKPISFFPMSWAINNSSNEYFYDALTSVELWQAPKEDVVAFMKSNPDVMYDLMSRVYKGTDGMTTRMLYLMSGNAYGRLITELIIHTKRFGKRLPDGSVELQVSEKDLAAQIGMARETVSREMKHLKNKGIVSLNKNVLTINNLEVLEAELTKES